jgi:hypothetical protein
LGFADSLEGAEALEDPSEPEEEAADELEELSEDALDFDSDVPEGLSEDLAPDSLLSAFFLSSDG